jgi:hypothetical protein
MNTEMNKGHEFRMLSDSELEQVTGGSVDGMCWAVVMLVDETFDTVRGAVHGAAQWVADKTAK